jgi:hypothetical protein
MELAIAGSCEFANGTFSDYEREWNAPSGACVRCTTRYDVDQVMTRIPPARNDRNPFFE